MVRSYARLLTALCGLATTAVAVHPLVVQGTDFVNTVTKERFDFLGIDYQPGGSSGFNGSADPLSDASACLRDAALMQRLGINAIRVYNLAPSANHDQCASIFNAAGIYMLLDVNSPLPNGALSRTAPWETYNPGYMKQVFGVIESFKNYPNVVGFFAANEVINEDSVIQAPEYIRAVTRDMHDYISKNANRTIPVGYSAADVRPILVDTFNYLTCTIANSTSSAIDFFGLNSYSWCGNATFQSSGYSTLVQDFKNGSQPVMFSETGCNLVSPRPFSEVQSIYGPDMLGVFSGALFYEWTQEQNNFGLVQINSNGSVSLIQDYVNLQSQYNLLNLTALQSASVSQTSAKSPTCDSSLISNSTFLNTFDVPARVKGIDDLINNGVTAGVHSGALVSVSSQDIPEKVYNTDGSILSGVRLNALADDKTNTPGSNTSGNTTSTPTSSGTASAATTSHTGAASTQHASGTLGVFGAIFALAAFAV